MEEESKIEERAKYNEDGELDSDEEAIETRKKLNKVVKEEDQVEELADADLDDIDEWTHKAKKNNKKKKNEKNKGEKQEIEQFKKAEQALKDRR